MMRAEVIKGILVASVLLFVFTTVMIISGCLTAAMGAGESFFCGPFCTYGKVLFGLTLLGIAGYFIKISIGR